MDDNELGLHPIPEGQSTASSSGCDRRRTNIKVVKKGLSGDRRLIKDHLSLRPSAHEPIKKADSLTYSRR
jgi:hypothetical protein